MMKTWLRIIAVLEIIGGISGIGIMLWVLVATPTNIYTFIFAAIAAAIYILSLVAGIALWRRRRFGRTASIIVQCIQIPKIISPLVVFMFSFGIDLWVHYLRAAGLSNLGFEFRLGAFNQLFFYVPDAPVGFGVSVTGCIFLMMLLRYKPGQPSPETEPPLPPPPPDEITGSL
jgi:hypothetical protein